MTALIRSFVIVLIAAGVYAQDTSTEPLSIITKELPVASLWNHYGPPFRYGFYLQSTGGITPHRWRIVSGSLPRGLQFEDSGTITGSPLESGVFEFTVGLSDNRQQVERKLTLSVETPFKTQWARHAQVNGKRIDGSIKVSNTTGRDLDLTFVVLAVNDIGRATAIGYQHFPLKANTRDQELPFGDTLSPGNYAVNVDVVGEEPQSNMIFRARLVAEKEAITQGP
jgi:hypothetical protein